MTSFRTQLEAMGSALILIKMLPDGTVWSLTCTNDDDAESPSVLNIFTAEPEWPLFQELLALGKPTDRSTSDGEQFVSFRHGALLVSLIEEEKS